MSLSDSEKAAMREKLERQEQYAQKLATIQAKIFQVESKLVDELTNIRGQLQEIGHACSDAEKFFDKITKIAEEPTESNEGPSADSRQSEESSESENRRGSDSSSESGSGGVYFIIDDMEEYDRLVAYLIREEMEEILAARAAEAAELAGNGERNLNGAQ